MIFLTKITNKRSLHLSKEKKKKKGIVPPRPSPIMPSVPRMHRPRAVSHELIVRMSNITRKVTGPCHSCESPPRAARCGSAPPLPARRKCWPRRMKRCNSRTGFTSLSTSARYALNVGAEVVSSMPLACPSANSRYRTESCRRSRCPRALGAHPLAIIVPLIDSFRAAREYPPLGACVRRRPSRDDCHLWLRGSLAYRAAVCPSYGAGESP